MPFGSIARRQESTQALLSWADRRGCMAGLQHQPQKILRSLKRYGSRPQSLPSPNPLLLPLPPPPPTPGVPRQLHGGCVGRRVKRGVLSTFFFINHFFPWQTSELQSFFCNFARFLSFSLYKGSLEDWGKSGLRIGNRTQFHILLWIAFKEHPMLSHQPYYGSSSGAKVIILFERTKFRLNFLFWACSSLISYTAASFCGTCQKSAY